MDREKKDVFKVYNKIAHWFLANRSDHLMELQYLQELVSGLKKGARILDLGCGTGIPIYQYLFSCGFQVIGVDASSEMLKIAQTHFPEGDFRCQDMRNLSLDEKFDAVIAWHSLFHLPVEDQRMMFAVFARCLNPGGKLLFTSGIEEGETWGLNGGEPLFHASLHADEYHTLLKTHGFRVVFNKMNNPDCGGATVWLAVR